MKQALSTSLDGGAPKLGEGALEGIVDARHTVLRAGDGAPGRKQLGGRRNALFTADCALAYRSRTGADSSTVCTAPCARKICVPMMRGNARPFTTSTG